MKNLETDISMHCELTLVECPLCGTECDAVSINKVAAWQCKNVDCYLGPPCIRDIKVDFTFKV